MKPNKLFAIVFPVAVFCLIGIVVWSCVDRSLLHLKPVMFKAGALVWLWHVVNLVIAGMVVDFILAKYRGRWGITKARGWVIATIALLIFIPADPIFIGVLSLNQSTWFLHTGGYFMVGFIASAALRHRFNTTKDDEKEEEDEDEEGV